MGIKKMSGFSLSIVIVTAGIFWEKPPVLSAKIIERNIVKLTDSLYVYRYETSNIEYQTFLNSLRNSNNELYNKSLVDSAGWQSVYKIQEPPTGNFYHRHPAFSNHPVVNIRYVGAVEYCKWLTGLYNNDRKRKFRKVVFTLPAEKEWTTAGQAGRDYNLYPWSSYYLVNKRGYFMCNFKPVGDPYYVKDSAGNPMIINYEGEAILHAAEFPEDKSFYLMKVNSFTPNDLGIYNMSGNAAEMTDVPGYAMGGSWNSYGGEITVKSIKRYSYPSPEVGFRIFMRIIEK